MGTAIGLVGLLFIAAVIAGIWRVVQRGLQLKQLVEDGVDVEGVVVRQFKGRPRGPQNTTDHFIRYKYRDSCGREHEFKFKAARDFWAGHPEGKRIAVVYSKSKPSVSGPKYMVEQAREALAKRSNVK